MLGSIAQHKHASRACSCAAKFSRRTGAARRVPGPIQPLRVRPAGSQATQAVHYVQLVLYSFTWPHMAATSPASTTRYRLHACCCSMARPWAAPAPARPACLRWRLPLATWLCLGRCWTGESVTRRTRGRCSRCAFVRVHLGPRVYRKTVACHISGK
jgi:hypothetical protein